MQVSLRRALFVVAAALSASSSPLARLRAEIACTLSSYVPKAAKLPAPAGRSHTVDSEQSTHSCALWNRMTHSGTTYHCELTNRASLCHAVRCMHAKAAPSVGRCSSGLCAAFGRGLRVPTASDARWLPSAVRTSAWRSVSVRQCATAAQKCTAATD